MGKWEIYVERIAEMAYIKIANLGPIDSCEMEINDFTVLTGQQASGKSTVAKAIYFCRTIKNDIKDEILKYKHSVNEEKISQLIYSRLRNKFLQIFGTSFAMDDKMQLEYYYNSDTFVKISLTKYIKLGIINNKFVKFKFSSDIFSFINNNNSKEIADSDIKSKLNSLFHDNYDPIFIPAGRSLITILTSQLNYLFASMDDEQKRSIDYCTQKYIEYILKIKPMFSEGLIGLAQNKLYEVNNGYDSMVEYIEVEQKMEGLISRILKGNYVFANGEERLYLDDDKYVKINFASSGQQETVWLLNILFYLMINRTKAYIILEEPEAHLYPDAQNEISKILALMTNCGCQFLITTHSPYILGALNNLIYADYVASKTENKDAVEELVATDFRIKNCTAYKVQNGQLESCIEDTPERLIINEVIDGASIDINNLYNSLFDIEMDGE